MPRIDIHEHHCAGVTAFGGVPQGVTWLISSPEIPRRLLGQNLHHQLFDEALRTARHIARRCQNPATILIFDRSLSITRALRISVTEEELDPSELRAG